MPTWTEIARYAVLGIVTVVLHRVSRFVDRLEDAEKDIIEIREHIELPRKFRARAKRASASGD